MRRAACVERSLAAHLLCLTHGRGVTWVWAARFLPAETHAYIEVNGRPIGEPEDPDRRWHVAYRV